MRTLRLIALLSITCIAGASADAPKEDVRAERERLVKQFSKLLPKPEEYLSNASVFESNGFKVQGFHLKRLKLENGPKLQSSSSGASFDNLIIDSDSTFKVTLEKGLTQSKGGGLALYNRRSGIPMMAAVDQDGDGRLDFVAYTVTDEAGEGVLEVFDYDVDGQADVRIHKDHYSEIWRADRWYRVERRDGKNGILIDGQFVELQKKDRHWATPE